MQRYNDFVIDQYGTPVVSATITVFATGTSTPATLYADDSLTPLANPTTTDGLGKYYFYAADGRYDIQISGANFTTQTITDVLLEDPQDGSTAVLSGVTITTLTGILAGNGASPVGLAAAGTADQILPTQTGQAGKILTTDGTNSSWTSTGAGSVFSVDVSGGTTGLTTSGGPITGSGTITLAGTLNSGNGGTGATIYAPGQLLIGNNAGGLTKAALTAGTGISVTNGDGSVTVAMSTPVSEANGGTGETTYTDGQLLIGNTAGGLTKATLTAGSGVSITNGDGSITVAVLGAGTGDVVGPASSVDGELVLFNGITGKLLKSATTTGILKATSGVLSAASSGTDYAPATSGTSILKGNGSGGFSSAAASDITGQVITGFSSGAGTVAATDTILQAINKLDGNDGTKAPTSHAANASTYGYGDTTNAGHLRVGSGLAVTTGTVSLDLASDQSWSGSQRATPVTDNDGSFDMNAANDFLCTPTGTITLAFTNYVQGQRGSIYINNTSNYTVGLTASRLLGPSTAATTLSATGKYWVSYWCVDATSSAEVVLVSVSPALS